MSLIHYVLIKGVVVLEDLRLFLKFYFSIFKIAAWQKTVNSLFNSHLFINFKNVLGLILSLILAFNFWKSSRKDRCVCSGNLSGKVSLVTGGSTGYEGGGFKIAKELASRGSRVFLVSNNVRKGLRASKEIIYETGNSNIIFLRLNVADLDSARKLASEVLAQETKLDILVLNERINLSTKYTTQDGHELHMVSNYLNRFLLTNLLFPLFQKAFKPRIIVAMNKSRIKENTSSLYYNSQVVNALFVSELSYRLKPYGISVNSYDPETTDDWTETDFQRQNSGAQTALHMCVSKNVSGVTGEHFYRRSLSPLPSIDREVAHSLWKKTADIVRLDFEDEIPFYYT